LALSEELKTIAPKHVRACLLYFSIVFLSSTRVKIAAFKSGEIIREKGSTQLYYKEQERRREGEKDLWFYSDLYGECSQRSYEVF
jgi:hypothetical protein